MRSAADESKWHKNLAVSIKSTNFDSNIKLEVMKKQNSTDTQLSLFPDSEFEPLEKEQDSGTSPMVAENSDQDVHYDFTDLFNRLAQSSFRSGFHLHFKERTYIDEKGLETIRQHARDFVAKRLAPSFIPNDGKQTPMRGHPVFIAQHATGCCCRGCFSKWHHIPQGRALTQQEQNYAVNVLMEWITKEYKGRKQPN